MSDASYAQFFVYRFSADGRRQSAGGDAGLRHPGPSGAGWPQRDPRHARLHQRPAHDRAGVRVVRRGLEHAGRPRRADRHRPVFRRLLEHAGVELWIDQRRVDRSANRPAIRVAVPEDLGGRHRDGAEAAARASGRDASARRGGPVVWRLPGVPVGGDVSRLHGWRCAGGDFAAAAGEPPGGGVAGVVREGSELEWRRLLRPRRRARHDDRAAGGHADALRPAPPACPSGFADPAARDAELRRIAEAWADVFDANSLFILGDAMARYDVAKDYGRIKVPVLYVLSRTDALFPPSLAPGVMAGLRAAGVDAAYVEIDSEHGHLASGADAGKWAPALRAFIARLEA